MDMPLSINNSELEASTSSREDSCLIDIKEMVEEENSAPVQKLLDKVNSLEEVIKYYLDGKGHASLTNLVLDQLILLTVALTGAGLYATAADDYAQSIGEELAGRINYMVCTCLPALVVLYNSTELFLVMRRAETIPEPLTDYLISPFTPRQKKIENIAITTGAAISALPLAAVSYMYPIPGFSKTLLVIQGIIVLIDNTILHLFPFKLAFSAPLYRLPSLPFEFIIQQIMTCRLSQEEREQQQLQTQINQQYRTIKQYLINHLDQGQKLLSVYGFKFSCCSYTNEITDDISNLKSNLQHSPTELLIALLNRLHEMAPDRRNAAPSNIRQFFRTASYLPGALWVMSSCSGFLAAPVNEMTELTSSAALGATLSAPPIYFLGVLLAFFGGNALQNTFDYFTDWKDDAVKVPMAFKLYPKTSVLLILISMYLSAFSYAAGAQLINDNFNGELEFLRPYLLDLAKSGLTFLGFTAMIDFFNNVLSKFGQYGSNENAETVIKLSEVFAQLKNSLQRMKPSLFIQSLAQMDEKPLKNFLNLKQKTVQQEFSASLVQLAEKLKTKLIKESKSMDVTNIVEASLFKLLSQHNDQSYNVEKIEALLNYFDTEPELNLSSSLKEVCQEYKAVCKLIKTLESISLVNDRELDTYLHASINNDDNIPSSETTPLIRGRAPGGSIFSNFFHPRLPHYSNDRASSLSPVPGFSRSNQMGV